MQLYYADASPYARKVRACAAVLGVSDEIEIVNVSGTPINTGNLPIDKNPLGKIPCLVMPNGEPIYDSRVITQYLNSIHDGDLYPDGEDKWAMLTLEATGDGMMDAAIAMVYEKRVRPEEIVFDDWIEAQWQKISRAIENIEMRWMGELDKPVNAAQISLGCALGYLDFRLSERNWRNGHDSLAKWFDGFSSHQAMILTAPKG